MSRIAYVRLDDGSPFVCKVPDELGLHPGDDCIIKTDKMLDWANVTRIEEYSECCATKSLALVERCATLQDKAKINENALMSKMAMDSCAANAEKNSLEMNLISVRYSFDRQVLVVMFVSEDRVDFREMVKELSSELRTRIEMVQIGVRDEAGMIGGMGTCGRELCCCNWIKKFESINVKMAKAQKLSLNPAAISGMCGRLKCCLRYENEQYRELGRNMPRDGAMVSCHDGEGKVVHNDIMAQRVRVLFDDSRVREYDVEDITVNAHKQHKKPEKLK